MLLGFEIVEECQALDEAEILDWYAGRAPEAETRVLTRRRWITFLRWSICPVSRWHHA